MLCSYHPRILNEHWCIYSCLQIPPRENWFQYVRREYATAINFPCIIILVTYIFLRYTPPPECWMLQGVPINMRLNPLFNLIHNGTSKSFVWSRMNELSMLFTLKAVWFLYNGDRQLYASKTTKEIVRIKLIYSKKNYSDLDSIRYNLIWHDPL